MKISPTTSLGINFVGGIIAEHKGKQVNWLALGLDITKEKAWRERWEATIENVSKYVKVEGQ